MSISGFHVAVRACLTLSESVSGLWCLSSAKMSEGRRGRGVEATSRCVVFGRKREVVLSERDLEVCVSTSGKGCLLLC